MDKKDSLSNIIVSNVTIEQLQKNDDNIRKSMINIIENWFYIGEQLNVVKQEKLYKLKGYKTFVQYTKTEFGISGTQSYNFINVYLRFNSPKYKEFKFSHLIEMLKLNDSQLDHVHKDMTTREIRSLAKQKSSEDNKLNSNENISENNNNNSEVIEVEHIEHIEQTEVDKITLNKFQSHLLSFILEEYGTDFISSYQSVFTKSKSKCKAVLGVEKVDLEKEIEILKDLFR